MKFYLASQNSQTPFSRPVTLSVFMKFFCSITNKIYEADCVVGTTIKKLLPLLVRYPFKKFLVWTNEPRYSTVSAKAFELPMHLAHIDYMNVFTNDIFWNNRHFIGAYHFNTANDLGINLNEPVSPLSMAEFKALYKQNKIAALFTNKLNHDTKLVKNGVNIDLIKMRCEYALQGHTKGILDIYGNNWPNGIATENSGNGFEKTLPWWLQKINILENYKFNFCPENTAYKYYTTEKIWHALKARTLPIYSSFNTNIYETFPKESFVDIQNFSNADELFDFVFGMNDKTYLERLNQCIEVYNRELAIKRSYVDHEPEEFVKKILERLY